MSEPTSHFAVVYFCGDPTGEHPEVDLAGHEPSLTIIACGPEQFCWDALYAWTSRNTLRDGETAEVLQR